MNLQLFAFASHTMQILKDDGGGGGKKKEEKKIGGFDPNSLVDYLKQRGEDSSYSARAVIADELGITNYKGSGEQNTQMLKMLTNGTTPATNAPKVTDKPKTEPKAETKPVVDNTGAPAVTAPATINGVDADTMQALNTPYVESSAVQEAWNVTNAMKEKLVSGRTSYTDQIQSLMNQIRNRDKFSYDVDTDMLFQQALASAMGSGQQAMKDTIGQASALTGGYASSYATSAGNQAYNAYIQDAYNNLPEYYQMALEAYNMEGQDMYNQLSMLSDADATEYGRMYDAWNTSHTEWQDLYNQDYSAWRDNWNNNYNMATLGNSDYWSGVDNTYRYDVMENNNEQSRLDREQEDKWNQKELDYKNSALAQDQNQFNAKYDLNGDGVVNHLDNAVEEKAGGTTKIDQKHFTGALEAINNGGTAKLNEFLNSLGGIYSDEELEAIAEYAGSYSSYVDPNDPENPVPYTDRDWKVVDDGGWHIGKLDDNAKIKDQYDNEITIEALYEQLLAEGMTKKQAKEYLVALQDELGI